MKIEIDRKALSDAMTTITTVINSRHVNTILHNVLIEIKGHVLTLKATDLEISAQCTIQSESSGEGRFLVNALRLAGLLKDLQSDNIQVEYKDALVYLQSKNDKVTLQTADAEDFPNFPLFEEEISFKLQSSDLHRCFTQTAKSVAGEKGRFALNGVLMKPKKEGVEFCGTDGRRLAYCQLLNESKEYSFSIIIPRRGIELFSKASARFLDEDILICPRENEILARVGNTVISSQLVEGEYPDYWSVIPQDNDKKFIVRRQELLHALRLVGHMINVESRMVIFNLEGEELLLKTRSHNTGSAEARVPITYSGEAATIGFDLRYVIDGLELMNEEDVICEFKDNQRGAIFHSGKKEEFFYVVMPLEGE